MGISTLIGEIIMGEGIVGARDEGIKVETSVAILGEDVLGIKGISSGGKIESHDIGVM